MGWVIVEFPGSREVFVDDQSQGPNRDNHGQYRVLIIEDGLHTFRLGGAGVSPLSQDVTVMRTSIIAPLRVSFLGA